MGSRVDLEATTALARVDDVSEKGIYDPKTMTRTMMYAS